MDRPKYVLKWKKKVQYFLEVTIPPYIINRYYTRDMAWDVKRSHMILSHALKIVDEIDFFYNCGHVSARGWAAAIFVKSLEQYGVGIHKIEAAELFGVSTITLRRRLTELEDMALLEENHGV